MTLPTPSYDPDRFRSDSGQSLDNASVYLGGRSNEQEVDAGLSWEVLREPDGSISSSAKAFRPFWRTNKWHSAPARPDLYFYPGDTLRLTVQVTHESDTLQLDLLLLHRAGQPTITLQGEKPVWAGVERVDAASAQDAEWSSERLAAAVADPLTSFSVIFDAPGFAAGCLQEFKRVNGLDQRGGENKAATPTSTTITGAVWREVNLLRAGRDSGKFRVPMTPARFTDMRCPDPSRVVVESFGNSGERVDLLGISSQVGPVSTSGIQKPREPYMLSEKWLMPALR